MIARKAIKIVGQYGIAPTSVYGYANFDQLAKNSDVKLIFVLLPNGMHEEYVVRGGQTHSLRETDGDQQSRG